jgi:hypothetical protein
MGGRVAYWTPTLTLALACSGCGRVGFDGAGSSSGSVDGGGSNMGSADGGTTTTETFTLPSVADTALNSFAPTLNYGAALSVNVRSDAVSTFVGLIRFDLSTVTGTVTSARLRITTGGMVLSAGTIDLMRVLEAWDEGTQVGGTGSANYGFRQDLTEWLFPGCGPGSRDSAIVAQLQPFATDTRYEVELATASVQTWVDDPGSNHGVVLVPVGTGNGTVVFSSRESATPPELVLEVAP